MNQELAIQAQGRWTDILAYHGIAREFLRNKHGPCPICQGRDRFRFDNKNGNGTYYCSGCGAGDGATLLMKYCGFDFKTAADEVRKIIGQCKMTTSTPSDPAKNEARLKNIHAGLQRITPECIVSRYLAGRGIKVMPERDCYFHPGIDYYQDGKSVGKFPAMVSTFRTVDGETSTMHITYLHNDGSNKLDVDSPRKILPTIRPLPGSAIRLFNPVDNAICIAEGIETALSFHMETGMPVWAAGNAGNLAAMEIPEDIKHIAIVSDSDKNFVGQEAAYTLARRLSAKGDRESIKVITLIDQEQVIDSGNSYDFNDYVILNASA